MNGFFNNTYGKIGKMDEMSTNFETLQKARQDLIGEIQAIMEYDTHIHNTQDRLAQSTWENIKGEELTHVGELLALIDHLDPTQRMFVENGIKEFSDRKNNNT